MLRAGLSYRLETPNWLGSQGRMDPNPGVRGSKQASRQAGEHGGASTDLKIGPTQPTLSRLSQ